MDRRDPIAPGVIPLRGEGQWVAGRLGTDTSPVLFTTFKRPDARHPGIVAGVARINAPTARLRLVAGTTQPDKAQVPVGAENPVTSRDLHILVDETAEPVASQRPDDRSGGWRGTARGRALIQRSVRTVGVVMPDVLA